MTVHVYKSTDAGAPSQFGGAGTIIGILDACLVNGYGSKAAAGWSKPYSGTNIGVYKGVGANAKYLRVDDSDTTNSAAAKLVGYATMSDASTGTGAFPTVADAANGVYIARWYTDATANSTNIAWIVVATDKFFWFFISKTKDAGLKQSGSVAGFGEFPSRLSGDTKNTILIASKSGYINTGGIGTNGYTTPYAEVSLASDYTGLVPGRLATLHTAFPQQSSLGVPYSTSAVEAGYPCPIDGAIHMGGIRIYEPLAGIRGTLPGCLALNLQRASAPYKALDVLTGISGKEFTVVPGPVEINAYVVFETSDTW